MKVLVDSFNQEKALVLSMGLLRDCEFLFEALVGGDFYNIYLVTILIMIKL